MDKRISMNGSASCLVTKVRYKLGLALAATVRCFSRPTRMPNSPIIPCAKKLFLISSTINCPTKPMLKSVFTNQQRFEQTIETISSIRMKVEDVFIVLVDNSPLSSEQIEMLDQQVDMLMLCADDPEAIMWSNSLNKGAGEVYAVMRAMEILRYYDFEMMFKICGRYMLSEQFDLDVFSKDKFSFCPRAVNSCSTILYSYPKSLLGLYLRQLRSCMIASSWGVSIEAVIDKGLPPSLVHELSTLGVRGYLSQTGDALDY